MIELDGNQIRQFVDVEQVFRTYRDVRRDHERRFRGSMSWKTVSGHDYLYLKKAGKAKSLGRRSPETEQRYRQFVDGRDKARARLRTLDETIQRMAPINRAMRLGRFPHMAARVLRRIDQLDLLGNGLRVVGTHALYAYESLGGVRFDSDQVATQDIDLLYDARSGLKLVGNDPETSTVIAQLRHVDPSFQPTGPGRFRAVNDRGFMVDLITPLPRNPTMPPPRANHPADQDLQAVEITGLSWLENSPAIDRIVIDERGFPLRIVAPDPRAFAAHKAWVAQRDDRDPIKRRRDHAQAAAVIAMVVRYTPDCSFDDPALHFLPQDVRHLGNVLANPARLSGPADENWSD